MNRLHRAGSAAILGALAGLASLPAAAQGSDDWRFGAQIYGYFPSLSGESNFKGSGGSPDVTVDVDKIIDNIKFVMMGSFEAKKGRWGGFTDLMYLDVGSNKSGTRDLSIGGIEIPATASASVNYDLKGWIWTIAGEYAMVSQPGMTMDVFAGARMVDLEQDINWGLEGNIGGIPTAGRTGDSNVSRTNWDGIIGVKGRWHFGADNRWFVPYYVDVGTGDSDLTWQAMAGIGYSWKSMDVVGVVALPRLRYRVGPAVHRAEPQRAAAGRGLPLVRTGRNPSRAATDAHSTHKGTPCNRHFATRSAPRASRRS